MRISEIILEDNMLRQQVLDLLVVASGEGIDSMSLDTLVKELETEGSTIDKSGLFDILNNLAIVRNIKDDVVFFNTDSDNSYGDPEPSPEKQDNTIDKMARKQVGKELDK